MVAGAARGDRERDYYGVLGVPDTASHDAIIRAHRRLARSSHPDVDTDNPQATERFERLVAAREVLGDPATRAAYDKLRTSHAPADVQRSRVPRTTKRDRQPGGRPEPPIRPGPVVWTPGSRRWPQP
jgi:curved DNA-binding protein